MYSYDEIIAWIKIGIFIIASIITIIGFFICNNKSIDKSIDEIQETIENLYKYRNDYSKNILHDLDLIEFMVLILYQYKEFFDNDLKKIYDNACYIHAVDSYNISIESDEFISSMDNESIYKYFYKKVKEMISKKVNINGSEKEVINYDEITTKIATSIFNVYKIYVSKPEFKSKIDNEEMLKNLDKLEIKYGSKEYENAKIELQKLLDAFNDDYVINKNKYCIELKNKSLE